MGKQYVQIIINSFHSVLESVVSCPVLRSEIREDSHHADPQAILVMIGVAGDVDGEVYMSMGVDAGKSLASQMLGGMEIDDDELMLSAVSELCNMMVGNACSTMNDVQVDMTPPSVVSDKAIQNKPHYDIYGISFSLEKLGSVDLNMLMRDRLIEIGKG